ncbi:MAG TPA: DMT family transporter [Thermodesulfobacteriota bacterium]
MSDKIFFLQPAQKAKLVLPVGLIAISFASILIKICDAPPLVIAAYRLGLATLLLLLFTLRRTLGELRRLGRGEILPSILAGIFLCFHFAFWITSLKYTSVASSVIFVTTNPIFVALASAFLLRERLSLTLLLSILIAVLGGIMIAWEDWDKGKGSLYGDILALLGAMMATGYLLVGRRVRQKMGLTSYITLVYGVAAILLIILALMNGDFFFRYSPRTYLIFFLLALFPQLIGHTSLNWALKFFSATLVAVFILGEPIGATLLAYLLLEEPLTYKILVGGALVLLGIYFSAREERKLGKL